MPQDLGDGIAKGTKHYQKHHSVIILAVVHSDSVFYNVLVLFVQVSC